MLPSISLAALFSFAGLTPDAVYLSAGLTVSSSSAAQQETHHVSADAPIEDQGSSGGTPEERLRKLEKDLLDQASALQAAVQRIDMLEGERAAALELEAASLDPSEYQEKFRFYGYLEVGLQRLFQSEKAYLFSLLSTQESTFLLGNINMFLDFTPSASWRALIELRLLTYNGSEDFGLTGYRLITGAVREVTNPGITLGAASISTALIVERAEVEWSYNDHFSLKAGLWLTPWGIWNVDHGSPTLISLTAPFFQVYRLYPTQQLGLAASGRWHFHPWQIGYHLGISNGRVAGPDSVRYPAWTSFDISDDKMVTGRLYAHLQDEEVMTFGLSGYWGTSQLPFKEIASVEPLRLERGVQGQLKEWGLGADLSLDIGDLRFRGEFTYTRYFFRDGIRPIAPFFVTHQHPDSAQWGAYFLIAYTVDTEWVQIIPYFFSDIAWWPAAVAPRDLEVGPTFGINFHFTPEVLLKTQYTFSRYFDLDGDFDFSKFQHDDIHALSARIVVSF